MDEGLTEFNERKLNELLHKITDITEIQAEAERNLQALKISNAQKLFDLVVENERKAEVLRLNYEQSINEKLIKMRIDPAVMKQRAEMEKKFLEEMAAAKDDIERAATEERYKAELALAKKNNVEFAKMEEARNKIEQKNARKRREEESSEIRSILDNRNLTRDEKFDEIVDALQEIAEKNGETLSREDAEAQAKEKIAQEKQAKAAAAMYAAAASFAKEIGNKAEEIGKAQSEIDTRLFGSNNKSLLGSY